MGRRNLIAAVVAAHVAAIVGIAALFGGCAREKKAVRLAESAPVQEIRAPEAEPETLVEPKVLVEEKELLVSREPEFVPTSPPAGLTAEPPAVVEKKEEKPAAPVARVETELPAPVVPEVKKIPVSEVKEATHRVMPGESLWKISNIYGVAVADLARANNLKTDARVRIGQMLVIPGGKAKVLPPSAPEKKAVSPAGGRKHQVRKGETLTSIARNYGVSMKAIIEANSIEDPGKIRAGQTLIIPQ